MRNFADLAYPLPTFLPTFKSLIFIHLPTLPTFQARARTRVNIFISVIRNAKKKPYMRENMVGKVGKVGKSLINKYLDHG